MTTTDNYCQRCGKRFGPIDHIHTCSPNPVIKQLREELAACKKDVERISYIADFCKIRHLQSGFWSWQTGLSSTPHLRGALDAAMKGQSK